MNVTKSSDNMVGYGAILAQVLLIALQDAMSLHLIEISFHDDVENCLKQL